MTVSDLFGKDCSGAGSPAATVQNVQSDITVCYCNRLFLFLR